MEENFVKEVKIGLNSFPIGYFDTPHPLPKKQYYEYFDHPDIEVRRYSFAAFLVLMGNWDATCSFVIYKDDEFDQHVGSILRNRDRLKKEFPNVYIQLLDFLKNIDRDYIQTSRTENTLDPVLRDHLIKVIDEELASRHVTSMKLIIEEMKLQPFFKSDF
ncbi:hypothetical protein [Jeotgalibacillus aurantiacus]|uniref:hypothetical protein n=1 Tax=Jeotgalibacillus aurantiacus TaxID=2763266 RepID=UPI001D0B24ED|nr:hypothetical protein [Jeotgalibacillus aurantiacus]